MCGIVGILNLRSTRPVEVDELKGMVAQMIYRGPDEYGLYRDRAIGLGVARLSIIDLVTGSQPMTNETEEIWTVFNGEIYNYSELQEELVAQGHRFKSRSDTETLTHLYEEHGIDFVTHLNGQFAIALWDRMRQRLILARDRAGIRPLFYTIHEGRLLFASVVKSLFAIKGVARQIDPVGLDQVITFWTTVGQQTAFKGVFEVPPGHFLEVEGDQTRLRRYWDYEFPDEDGSTEVLSEAAYSESLYNALQTSVELRLRSDVPVGAYISGGVDSAVVMALLADRTSRPFHTFSVEFEDQQYDESPYQRVVADYFETEHHTIRCNYADIGETFPQVVWHAEKPLFRTAPVPFFLLSRLVRQTGLKVVLSGEGADEVLWGYDTFKEHKIRLFWQRNPSSALRPLLLKHLFPQLPHYDKKYFHFIKMFYQQGLEMVDDRFYSHRPRWRNNVALKGYYSKDLADRLSDYDAETCLAEWLHPRFDQWNPLQRTQYLETLTLLPGYLLSSQGDRMSMAHSVEARYPFLDHNVIATCAAIPGNLKMRRLEDKYLLRRTFAGAMPKEIASRPKHAYIAPDLKSFFHDKAPDYVAELLGSRALLDAGFFDPKAVSRLTRKFEKAQPEIISYRDNMALVVILSSQLLHHMYVNAYEPVALPASVTFEVRGPLADS